MAETIEVCLSDEVPLEEAALADAISNRMPGTRAFALPPERIGNKTVVLIGNDALGHGHWSATAGSIGCALGIMRDALTRSRKSCVVR